MLGRGVLRALVRPRVLGATALCSVAAGFAWSTTMAAAEQRKPRDPDETNEALVAKDDIVLRRYTITRAAEKVLGSVVQIRATSSQNAWLMQLQAGSGFVIQRGNGKTYIVTNAHVVADMEECSISQGELELEGHVLGLDRDSDVALVEVDGEHWEPLVLGSSKDLRLGEFVIAAGSPMGLESSVSLGIISNKNASLSIAEFSWFGHRGMVASTQPSGEEDVQHFLQVDCSINPGSSGGPIVDLDARVVGVARMKAQGEGLSFAIPIEAVVAAVDRIKAQAKRPKKRIGIHGADTTAGKVLVSSVVPQSPAEQAGIKPGDLILDVGGKSLRGGVRQLREFVAEADGPVDITVIRNTKRTKMRCDLSDRAAGSSVDVSSFQ